MKMVDSFEKIPLEIFPECTGRICICCPRNCCADPQKQQKNKTNCVLGLSRVHLP